MFTLDQIKVAHAKVKTGAEFPSYIQDIMKLGVSAYETYVSDGHTNYFGNESYKISTQPKYEGLIIADKSNPDQFKIDLKEHQQGKTDFMTFCKASANAGVEKWVVSMDKMTCTYFDKAGSVLLTEIIPTP